MVLLSSILQKKRERERETEGIEEEGTVIICKFEGSKLEEAAKIKSGLMFSRDNDTKEVCRTNMCVSLFH